MPSGSAASTRWVPREGRSRTSPTSWPAQTPVALTTALAPIRNVSPVVSSRTSRPAAVQPERPGPGQHLRAESGGGACERDDEPRVVHELTVEREQPGPQPPCPQSRRERQCLGRWYPPRCRQYLARRVRDAAQHVARHQSRHRDRAGSPVVQRNKLRQRARQVWCGDRHQDVALGGALVGETDVTAREIAQAAVHELAGPAGRAEGEIVGVDQADLQPARGGIERGTGPGDARADDEQVDLPPSRTVGEVAGATGDVERSGGHGRAHGCSRGVRLWSSPAASSARSSSSATSALAGRCEMTNACTVRKNILA